MVRRPDRHAPGFAASNCGTSAVEFALIFPVLLIFMLLGIQVVNYVNAVRRVELLASSMSETLSQATPPSYGTTVASVSVTDLHFLWDSALVVFPFLMPDSARFGVPWWQDISVNFAGIQFTAVPNTNCSGQANQSACYTANVVWTSSGTTQSLSTYPGTVGPFYRPCTTSKTPQSAASNTATSSRNALPASVFGPASIVAVDVVFVFKPLFTTSIPYVASSVLPSITITRSIYMQPRYASLITFNTANNDGTAQLCPSPSS